MVGLDKENYTANWYCREFKLNCFSIQLKKTTKKPKPSLSVIKSRAFLKYWGLLLGLGFT